MKKSLGWEEGKFCFEELEYRVILRHAKFQDVVMPVGGLNGVEKQTICIQKVVKL